MILKITNTKRNLFCLFLLVPGFLTTYGQLIANFSASATLGCTPANIQFKDLSSGNPTSWFWDFGNGVTSDLQNPTATYINKGTYTVRLIIKNSSDVNYIEKQNYITVSGTPDVEFDQSIGDGCLQLPVTFNNTTNLFGSTIKSWLWNFGDGTTSVTQNASHLYNTHGTYSVTLIAETNDGCTDSLRITMAVKTGNKLAKVSFKAAPLDGCASTLRKFSDLSSSNANTWNWDFGDGGTSTLKNPSYHYTDTGWFSVKLTASDNGCADSIQFNRYVHVIGPIAKIRTKVNCDSSYTVHFYNTSIASTNYNWSFGDGDTSSIKNPFHTYKSTGAYSVKLTVSAGACIDSANYPTYIINQHPSYKINPSKNIYCKNDSVQFITTNYDSSLIRYYAWSLDSGLTRTPYRLRYSSINYVYTNPDNYPVPVLYIINKESCFDTIINKSININVAGASAGFSNSSPGCVGSNIAFSDQSKLYNNAQVKQWQWDFGDGDSTLTAASTVNYKYPFPGLYRVLLKTMDADGCIDTISHTINIADTPTIYAGNDTFICAGKSAALKATGGSSYTWKSSPYLSCTNCADPAAAPLTNSIFYVTGKNIEGCASKDSVKVNVQQQEALVVQPSADTICAGNTVQLTASGYDSYKWQPAGSLNNANIASPIASPLNNTVYTVTATDKSGCFTNTASINIIANPKPVVNIKDTEVTLQPGSPYQIITTYSPDVIKWEWQPPQWLNDATVAEPIAQPQQNITYTVYATNTGGCVSIDHVTISVVCNSSVIFIPNTFSPNSDGVNDYFFPRSRSPINIKTLKIFNRWGQEIFKKSDFSSNDQSAGWDGKFNGILQQSDVYVYIMQIACTNGSIFNEKGSLTLIR